MNTVNLDSFTRQYIVTALWSSNDESDETGGEPLDRNYSIEDIADESLDRMVMDCEKFQAQCEDLITDDNLLRSPDHDYLGTFGHDFWLTRNGHGAGFWDGDYAEPADEALTKASKSFGECYLYVGDDGKLYVS